jgi:serine/threonine protein kinase/formylglycine-generating enzyme required for sulfatase activity
LKDPSTSAEPSDPQVAAALRDYLERLDRGESVDREQFLLRHAQIADRLRSFIAAEDEVRHQAGARTPLDGAHYSTKSFAGHGQETVVPQLMANRNVVRGLAGRFGRYRIIRALGKGAMGTVYLAEDTQIERQVALKTPHFTEDPTGEQMERFFREARAAGNLRHPHICPIYDFGQIDGRHFITMAYIEGRPLSAFIQPDNQQAERQILLLVRKLASALQEAHDHGVVHRDLKPANIMVDKKGEPIIMDFGLAQQTRRNEDVRLTQTGNILGTPAFMSPEQVEGEPEKIGPPTDQYSLGVILYELLTGELPFRGSIAAVMGQILTKEPAPPSRLRTDLDARIEAVCLKMMAKSPSDRFTSAKAVSDEISSILKSPSAKTACKEKPASSQAPLPSGDRTGADAGASQVLKSLKLKTLTEKDLESLEELARKCYSRRDFEQVIQIVERIPEKRRNAALQALLEKSREKADEVSFLICDIDEAERLNDGQRALKKADELLKIKPGHHRAREIQEKFAGYGEGGAARIGLVKQFTQPWNEGGWIPWSALAFGLAVFGVMAGVIIVWLGRTAVVIDAQVEGINVAVNGRSALITVPGMQSIKVEPGDKTLTISYAGLKTITKSLSLKKGDKKSVTVSIVDSKLIALLDNEIAPLPADHEQGIAATPPPTSNSAATLPRTFKNALGIEFVLVPKGKSWLGGGGGIPGGKEVTIDRDFYLGKYEVTQDEWKKVTELTPSFFSRTGGGKDIVKDIADAQLERFPVDQVSWDDVQAFLERLNKNERETGWIYRLPNEVEWEYAFRGGPLSDKFESAYDFYFEKSTNQLRPEQANFGPSGLKRTCKVGSYKPNRLGLYDMPGNVGEWCDDGKKWADGTERRVHRGGDWGAGSEICRPAEWFADGAWTHSNNIGFRVARVPVGLRGESSLADAVAPLDEAGATAATVPILKKADYDAIATGKWIPVLEKETDLRSGMIVIPEHMAGDVIIRARVKKIGGQNLGIGLRRNEERPPKRGGYNAWFNGGNWFGIHKGGEDRKDLMEWHAPTTFDDYFEFAFSAVGETLTIYADGKRIGKVRDPDYRMGAIAIGALGGRSLFQNVEIMILDKSAPSRGEFHGIEIQESSRKSASTAAPSADRRAAEAVLALGGSVAIRMNDQEQTIEPGNTLPTGAFELTRVHIRDQPDLTDAALEPLRGATNLVDVSLYKVSITDASLKHLQGLANLEALDLSWVPVTDAGLVHLKRLVKLRALRLPGTGVTDVGLMHLNDLTQLEVLCLEWVPAVTDATLSRLSGLTKLRDLDLGGTRVTDAGLMHLVGLVKLEVLNVGEIGVTDAGLVHLAALRQLKYLNLNGTRVTDAGIVHLQELKQLESIGLARTRVTDAGIAYLEGLTKLEHLLIERTRVTDVGLKYLKDLTNLQDVNLSGTLVTAKGVEKLKKSLPQCRITANPAVP